MDISQFTKEQIAHALRLQINEKRRNAAKYQATCEERKEYARIYYEQNKEKVLEQQRKRRAAKRAAQECLI